MFAIGFAAFWTPAPWKSAGVSAHIAAPDFGAIGASSTNSRCSMARSTAAEGDQAARRIVRGHRHRHLIAQRHTNAMATQPPCELREHGVAALHLHAEVSARQNFHDLA